MTTNLLYILPFITAFIGWLTNYVAIKMLFKPRQAVKITGMTFHGLIPKRQKELAAECAEIIERELLQQNMLQEKITQIDLVQHLKAPIHRIVKEGLVPQLITLLPEIQSSLTPKAIKMAEYMLLAEIEKESKPFLKGLADEVSNSFQIKTIVEARIAHFDLDKLEKIVYEVSAKEFKTIEYIGAVLGFILGLGQVALVISQR